MIDYRLAGEALNRKPDYSFGNRVMEGMQVIDDSVDRQRELEKRAEMDRIGAFISDEISTGEPSENAIAAEIAKTMPVKGMEFYNDLQNRYQKEDQGLLDYEIEMAKLKPSLGPSVLNKASQNKFRARQLANIISTSQDPEEVEASKLEYGNLVSDYEQNAKPFLLQQKNSGTMINELGILPIEQVLMNRKNRQMAFDKDQADLTEKLRSGAIKDSDYITTAINKYRDNVKTNGFSPEQVSNLKRTLEVARKLAAAGNVAGMHAINIITNKSLDPGSAVLLSEAEAFTPQTLQTFIKKQTGKLVGVDARNFNVETTYKLAAAAIKEREKTSKDIANYNLNFINNELKARGSKRQITIKEIDPTYRPTAAELRKKK